MTKTDLMMRSMLAACAFSIGCSGPPVVTEAKSATPLPVAAAPAHQSNASQAPATLPPGHPAIDPSAAAAKDAFQPIEPAKNGLTVETIWKTRDTLASKTVVLRGRVVKFNGGILGVNWMHLQDGSGSAETRTNDITITSDADAAVGDVITVTGVVGLNKDLGSGYSYPVIIEQARIESARSARD